MQAIAVLITCFNRKEKTLKCLECLYAQLPVAGYEVDVYLTDDGCTDGTPDAVRAQFPKVHIIDGDGNLYWNRGMHTAWKRAAETKDYDFYLWLNDDTMIYSTAIRVMLEASKEKNDSAIICGANCSAKNGKATYGGRKINNERVVPNGILQECDIITGNFVLVPKIIYKSIGNLDWRFRHAIGDNDYGLRAKEAGFHNFVTPEFIGTCEYNSMMPKWCLQSTPIIERFKVLYSPLGYTDPITFFVFERRHFGLWRAVKHFFTINLRAVYPKIWYKQV